MSMRSLGAFLTAALFSAIAPSIAVAQSNLDKLQKFQSTGTSLDLETVAQGGRTAENLNKILERINLPDGFEISLYAIVPDARHMAVGPNVGVVFVGTRKTAVWTVTDRDKDRVADDVKRFAPSIDFVIPNGVCFSPDGFLYIAEQNRVLVFPAAEFFYEGPDVAAFNVLAQGTLIPPSEESYNHTARVCRIGPDDKLYIALGQPYNVSPESKMDLYDRTGIGGVIRVNRDGSEREVYALGLRNSVGIDFNPANGELWATDNQVDGMGDLIPPGELNRIERKGLNFGFPWYGGGSVRTTEYANDSPPDGLVFPEVEMDAHAADLGLTFYSGKSFPREYRGGVFSAQHGSWNRTDPVGARIMFTELDSNGAAKSTRVFADGWLNEETGEYLGRPVDVAQLQDGSILVSDDLAGAVYRIAYTGM